MPSDQIVPVRNTIAGGILTGGKSALAKPLAVPLALILLMLGACAPFDYAAASPEERQVWLDATAKGMASGLEKTLPRGSNGFYAEMGPTRTDAEAKTIDVVVNVTSGGEKISIGTATRDQMMEQVCSTYSNTDIERNGIAVSVRYMLPGGGTAVALTMSPENCARYAGG
ncbi:hypothetical protein GV829_07780 [Sphingomonas lacunae]|uniref:Uncharacterized protein n=1 Tax=Sphingomonas lacunae TaxID=2698828 RepID=A0A6M4AVN0_9SPHN|nr:hypothetical protein [Sphingomonas lacunae]QJQ32362.1 hypothetical protein GV829_07780 [Sphingomonas lacunae]